MKVKDFLNSAMRDTNIEDFVNNNNLGLIALAFAIESLGEKMNREESCCKPGKYPQYSKTPDTIDAFLSGKDMIIEYDRYYEVNGTRWVQSGPDLSDGFLVCPVCGTKEDVHGA